MADRALWKGVVHFGIVTVPVKLYTAVREERISFNLLHNSDRVRLNQEMVCPVEKKPVPREERVRGYRIGEDRYVVVPEEELAELEPSAGRKVEVESFVRAGEIDPRFFERIYYLGPDRDSERFEVLRAALRKTGLAGVCRWVMRKRAYFGALLMAGENLALAILRYADEVIPVSTLGLKEPRLDERELKTAHLLIDTMASEWKPEKYRSDYQARLRALIEAKAAGRKIPVRKIPRARATPGDRLLKTLEASVAAAKRKKDAESKTRAAG